MWYYINSETMQLTYMHMFICLLRKENKMKYLKIAFGLMVLSLILSSTLSIAYPSPSQVGVVVELPENNQSVKTSNKTKTTWTAQRYKNNYANTVLSQNCSNCQVAVRIYTVSKGDFTTENHMKPGETKTLKNPTSFSSPNDYYLTLRRYDFSALKTSHSGIWYIND